LLLVLNIIAAFCKHNLGADRRHERRIQRLVRCNASLWSL